MTLLKKFSGIFKRYDELDLAKGFKSAYESNNMEIMKSVVDKFVDHYPDSYFASCSMVIYVILLYNENPLKVPPNRLNNLSIMERNIRFFDKANLDSLDDEELELRQWYVSEVNKNVEYMESLGLRFSSEDK